MKKLLLLGSLLLAMPCQAARIFMGGSSGAPAPGSSNYIQNRNTLQSGATFYTSSGTVNYFHMGFTDGTSGRASFIPGSGILGIYSGIDLGGGGFISPPDFHLYDKNGIDYGGLSAKASGGAQLYSPGAISAIGLDSSGITMTPTSISVATITTAQYYPYLLPQSLIYVEADGSVATNSAFDFEPLDGSGSPVLYMNGTINVSNLTGNAAGHFTDTTVTTRLAYAGSAINASGPNTFANGLSTFSSSMTFSGGRLMYNSAPSDGQTIVWSAANSRWQPGSGPALSTTTTGATTYIWNTDVPQLPAPAQFSITSGTFSGSAVFVDTQNVVGRMQMGFSPTNTGNTNRSSILSHVFLPAFPQRGDFWIISSTTNKVDNPQFVNHNIVGTNSWDMYIHFFPVISGSVDSSQIVIGHGTGGAIQILPTDTRVTGEFLSLVPQVNGDTALRFAGSSIVPARRYATIRSSAQYTADYTLIMPNAVGTAGQALAIADVVGSTANLTFSTISGSGGYSLDIGSAVVDGTAYSVLYVDASGNLAQNNSKFSFLDDGINTQLIVVDPIANPIVAKGAWGTSNFGLEIYNTSTASTGSLSTINFKAEKTGSSQYYPAHIYSKTTDVTNGSQTGDLYLGVQKATTFYDLVQLSASSGTVSISSGAAIAGPIIHSGIVKKTADYSLTLADSVVLASSTFAGLTLTLPTAVNYCGISFSVKKVDLTTGTISIATTSSQTVDSSTGTYLITQPNQTRRFISDCSNWTTWP